MTLCLQGGVVVLSYDTTIQRKTGRASQDGTTTTATKIDVRNTVEELCVKNSSVDVGELPVQWLLLPDDVRMSSSTYEATLPLESEALTRSKALSA